MAAKAQIVDGVTQPDLDAIPDGTGVAVSTSGPVQGDYVIPEGVKEHMPWEVISLDGKSHGFIQILKL